MEALFGGGDPKTQVREWKQKMRSESRALDRQIRTIEREEKKVKQSIKAAAKRGDQGTMKMMAREIVRSRKHTNRLHTAKAQMNSVVMQMENQVAQQKVTGHMTKSAEVMRMMNKLTKVEQVSATMQALQQEMCKAGVVEEMVDDAFSALDDDDDDEAADAEVEQVMAELAAGQFDKASAAPTAQVQQQSTAAEAAEDEEDMSAMEARLAALK